MKPKSSAKRGTYHAGSPSSATRTVSPPPPIAIVVSTYNEAITDALLVGAVEAYEEAGGDGHTLRIIYAPGAYELPLLALSAAATGRYAGVVALGCILKGQTRHDRIIAQSVADGLMHASLQTGLPIGLGVITANTPKQARERAGGPRGNKGVEAMRAVLASIAAIGELEAEDAALAPDESDRRESLSNVMPANASPRPRKGRR
jgi:6,7-dimethyl-8-ribityllumazine synthase